MPAGIRLHTAAAADIPTPEADQVTVFVEETTGEPSYKNEADVVTSLVPSAPTYVVGIPYVIDGGGSVITTGVKGDLYIPFDCTITGWTILLDQSGSIVIDIWKDTYANYPPVVGDSITASDKPTVSGATKGQDLAPTGWTGSGAVAAGSTLRFNVDSIATANRATIVLHATRT